MSHTLHRMNGCRQSNDYVILVMPARGHNNTQVAERYGKYMEVFAKYTPRNMGGMRIGILAENTPEELKQQAQEDAPMVHAVFANRKDMEGALKELRERDYGFSVVVSGDLNEVREAAKAAGLAPHSYHFSLGVWGNKAALPAPEFLEFSTMCGHSMVPSRLVEKLVAQVKSGKKSVEKAALQMTRPCLCGIFNPAKAEALLRKLM